MKRTLSFLCAAALVIHLGIPGSASETWTGITPLQSLPDLGAASQGQYTQYRTFSRETENSTELQIIGNRLQIKRRSDLLHSGQDQIFITQNNTAVLETEAGWSYLVADSARSGYDLPLELWALPSGTYTVEIRSKDAYTYTALKTDLVKTPAGCYVPKSDTVSMRHNYGALQRLESGSAPNDFEDLKEGYAKNQPILNSIQAKAKEVTAGCHSGLEKARAVNRWIAENIAYDADISGERYHTWIKSHPGDTARLDDPLHAFQNRYAMCYGYAKLTVLMMGYAGVECVYLTGRMSGDYTADINRELGGADTLENMNHAWNAVKIDGSWHFLDTCSDALQYYHRTNQELPATGYRMPERAPIYQYTFPSLQSLSKTHIALRVGVKNAGKKVTAAPPPDGWQSDSRFYVDGVYIRDAWQKIGGNLYRFNATGIPRKGWQMVEGYWRYFDDAGVLATGVQTIKDGGEYRVYTLDSNGCVTANDDWVTFHGAVRYYRGMEMLTGWQFLDGYWRYFDDTGALYREEAPLLLDGVEYRVNSEGILRVDGGGWVSLNGEKRYLDGTEMRTGLQHIGGNRYLFDSNGVMLTGWQTVEGKTFYFDQSGAMLTGWQFLDGSWYSIHKSNGRRTGIQSVGGVRYFFDAQGRLSAGGWVDVGEGKIYFAGGSEKNGVLQGGTLAKGWKKVDGKLRFFDRTNGILVTNQKSIINENNQKWYSIDKNGVATPLG